MDEFDKIRAFSNDIRKTAPTTEQKDTDYAEMKVEELQKEMDSRLNLAPLELEGDTKFHSMRLHLIALSAFIAVIILIFILFSFFSGKEKTADEIPVIAPTGNPVKVVPTKEQQGGMDIPNQDKLVYDRIRSDSISNKVESLFPQPEEPVPPTVLAMQENSPDINFVSMDKVESVNPLDKKFEEKTKMVAAASVFPPKKQEEIIDLDIQQPVVASKIEELPLAQKESVAVTTVTPKAVKKTAVNGEIWRVQLMSSSSKETVQKAWKQILKKNSALLSGLSYQIVPADIAGKGTFYRLQVGKFQDRNKAVALCAKLKANKQDCIPAK